MKVVYSLEGLPPGFARPVATIGNFDGLHLGHRELMGFLVRRASEVGGTPAVVTFHPHPLQVLLPGNAPPQMQTLPQKLETLESLGIRLAFVVPFDRELARMAAREFARSVLWGKFRLSEIYVGPNFAFGHRRAGSFNLLKEVGEEEGFLVGKIHQVQFRGSRVSSTAVRQALVAGQVALARRLLGRPFALEGEIVHGDGRGAGIGVRTANLGTPNELIPRNGVYVTTLTFDRGTRRAVTNIGVRPTIAAGGPSPVSVETHVLDYDGSLYGKQVVLRFLVRLREERRFEGPDALLSRIRRDIAMARRYFEWLERLGHDARERPLEATCSPAAPAPD